MTESRSDEKKDRGRPLSRSPERSSISALAQVAVIRQVPVEELSSAEADMIVAIERGAFELVEEGCSKKVLLLRRRGGGREAYLPRRLLKRKLVVHPGDAAAADRVLAGTGGVNEGLYHNSNMGAFPLRLNGGAKATRYGVGYRFESLDGLVIFLEQFAD